jgi:hypothetical protein
MLGETSHRRAFFDAKVIRDNPITRHLVTDIPPGGDRRDVWLGPDVHFISACVKNGKEFSWKVTHKDEADVEEGWVLSGNKDEALKVIEGWDPILQEMVQVFCPIVSDLTGDSRLLLQKFYLVFLSICHR